MAPRPRFNVLSVCSGGGGLELGLHLAIPATRVVCYVEREAYAASLLVSRAQEGLLDEAPVWSDLASFDASAWRGKVDCVAGGFPCQPWSAAGKRQGTDDERWLWPSFARAVRDADAGWVLVENVPGLLAGGAGHVLGDLADLGFDAEWMVLSAASVGAPHLRRRVFILAHRRGYGPSPSELLADALWIQRGERTGRERILDGDSRLAESESVRLEYSGGPRPRRTGPPDEGPEMGDASGTRRPEAGLGRDVDAGPEPETRGGDLADAASSGLVEYGTPFLDSASGGLRGRNAIGYSDAMADPDGDPRREHSRDASVAQTGPQDSDLDRRGSEDLADAASGGLRVCGEPSGGDRLADGSDAPLVDADLSGGRVDLEGERPEGGAATQGTSGPGIGDLFGGLACDNEMRLRDDDGGNVDRREVPILRRNREGDVDLPLFPPGPGDADVWREILSTRPDLEPSIRRMADGVAYRVDRLRLTGNGVVPIVAATAVRRLLRRLSW